MKKYLCLVLLVFIAASCTEDVKFNTPAYQGLKNNVFWRAQSYSAYTNTGGYLFVEGHLGNEAVILQLPSTTPGTYVLGVDEIKKASFTNTFSSSDIPEFSTGTNKGNGQVVITEFNAVENTISGTFKFTAINADQDETEKPSVTFTEGVFYKVPFTGTSNF